MNKKIMSLAVGAFMTAAVFTPIQSNAETICVNGVCELIFDYTGSGQVFDVPNGVTSIDFVVTGAQGARGGKGGEVSGTLHNLPSQLQVYVGGSGALGALAAGGYNGGGAAGGNRGNEGSGGGASDIRFDSDLASRIVVAGGGGGGGGFSGTEGAPGGMEIAASAQNAQGGGGKGGTQTAGGNFGPSNGGDSSTSGSFGLGGSGGISWNAGGGGGGGGWYGGGGGGSDDDQCCSDGGGGGGGSSFADNSFTLNISHAAGVQEGNGQITLRYEVPLEIANFSLTQLTNSLALAQITFNRVPGNLIADFFEISGEGCSLSSPNQYENQVSLEIMNCAVPDPVLTMLSQSLTQGASGLSSDFASSLMLDLAPPVFALLDQNLRFNTQDIQLLYSLDDQEIAIAASNLNLQGCQSIDWENSTASQLAILGCGQGVATLTVYKESFRDTFGNAGPALDQTFSFEVDTIPPVSTWTPVSITGDNPFVYQTGLSFSEQVSFDPESVVFEGDSNCTLDWLESPIGWDFSATCGYGEGVWKLDGSDFVDSFGNPGSMGVTSVKYTNQEPVALEPTPTPTPTPTPGEQPVLEIVETVLPPVSLPESSVIQPRSQEAENVEVEELIPNSAPPQETSVEIEQEAERVLAPTPQASEPQLSIAVEEVAEDAETIQVVEGEEIKEDQSPVVSDSSLQVQLAQPVAGEAISLESKSSTPWLMFGLAGFVVLLGFGIWRFSGK